MWYSVSARYILKDQTDIHVECLLHTISLIYMLCVFSRKLSSTNWLTTSYMAKRTSKSYRKSLQRSSLMVPCGVLTVSRTMKQFFKVWVPILCAHAHMPIVLHYSTDLQRAIMCQETKQCTNKGREEEDCEQVNMNVNNADFRVLSKIGFACFMRKEMRSAHLLDLKHSHKAFWWVTLNANIAFVYKKTPQGRFKVFGEYQRDNDRTLMSSLPLWQNQTWSTFYLVKD